MIESELQRKMIERLLKPSPEDRAVRDEDFQEVLGKVRVEIDRVVGITDIPGLHKEDVETLLIMKTHQMLRRRKYDVTSGIKPNPLFYQAYRNFVRDIYKGIGILERQGLDFDGVHYSYLTTFPDIDEVRNVTWVDEVEDDYVPLNLPEKYMVYQQFEE